MMDGDGWLFYCVALVCLLESLQVMSFELRIKHLVNYFSVINSVVYTISVASFIFTEH